MIIKHHQSYREWVNELAFYHSEINIFQKELNLLVEKHPNLLSIIEHVDEYRQIFEKKKHKIAVQLDRIKGREKMLAINTASDEGFREIQSFQHTFVQNMENLKKSFKRFVAKNMH